jgi:formylglycine-generating enzyme required for sulfatase activity
VSIFCLTTVASAGELREVVNSLGMRFVLIPAGEFVMGSPADDPQADADEHPRHRVQIARPYYLGVYEVTQAEYERVMGENPSWFSPRGGGRELLGAADTGRLPVEFISWDEATAFCARLGELPEEKEAGRTYRLPTEAEREYACRAGTKTRFSNGDQLTASDANVGDGERGMTRPVGSFPSNAWGLHDMHGNVWEWCADRYDSAYYQGSPTFDPRGPAEGTGRVVRGGDYRSSAKEARSANRDFTRQSRRDWGNGFRVVVISR